MAKVAVLVPSQELCNLAQPLVGTFPSITLMTLEYIKTSQAESRARELERQGCDLIVARGVQARIIKQSVKLPVVEISVTLQELASVMLELKSELALPCPRIGLIGVANMFSDTSRFNELFGIELKLYMVRQNEELANAVSQAQADAFVTIDCSAWLPETLDNMLFGNYTVRKDSSVDSYAEMAQDGTLYLSHVEMLPLETQYKLLCLIRGRFLHNGPSRPVAANVRIIASSTVSLIARVEKGEFRSDLYYALSVLSLEMLPLRRHRGDILGWTAFYLDEWQEKYKRYVHLTQGAQRYLQEYEWPGNLDQLNSVCERLVLLTQKRNIDEVFLRQQLEQIAPRTLPGTEQIVLYKDQKAVEIAALLKKHHGNRQQVAAELGVSKTTLWRYLKKYGIDPDYHC